MSDFNKPILTDLYTDVLTIIRSLFGIVAKLDYTGATNIPTGAKRINEADQNIEKYNGATWDISVSGVPVGIILPDAGATPPDGFLSCNGSAVSRTTYATLFARVSTTYGIGDGSTTFNVPDLRGRFPLGKSASGTGSTLGGTGGTIDHNHSVPAHYHGKGTLNITSSGSHTTSITHDHGSFNTTTAGGHGHAFNLAATGQVIDVRTSSTAGAGAIMTGTGASNGTRSANDSTVFGTVGGADGTHAHAIDVPNFSGNSSSTGVHTHASGDFSGSIGNTGGSNGDSSFNSGTNNPPFLAINYVIKY